MILLTGGAGFIGSAIAKHLRSHGKSVLAPSRDELDMSSVSNIMDFCEHRQPEALILCHGTYGAIGPMCSMPMHRWHEAIQTNLIGSVALIRYWRGTGPIIVFGGGQGGRIPLRERSSFAASKAALNAVVLTGAAEGLKIYGVAPGPLHSMMQDKLFASGASDFVKDEMRASLKLGVGVEPTLKIVDLLLDGQGEPGKFYAAREWRD